MISDYIDQNLILLKSELGWNIEDILYFTVNKRLDYFSFEPLFDYNFVVDRPPNGRIRTTDHKNISLWTAGQIDESPSVESLR